MIRREFLKQLTGGAATAGFVGRSTKALAVVQGNEPQGKTGEALQRICISSWSLHNYFKSTREKEFDLPGEMLALLDFPEVMADKYKVHNLEFCAPHFASTDAAYLKELSARLAKAHSRVVNMPIDIQEIWAKGGLSDPDKNIREAAVKASKKWVDIAAAIGSKAVRCDPGRMNPKDLAPTVESYKAIAEYGKSKGVHVVIENHGGVGSEHPEELVEVFKRVGCDFIGALPDFANFPDEAIRAKGLELLFPYARGICHAKGLEFDSNGNETKFNFPRCIEISKKAGFKGVYSVEFEGPGDPYEGVQKVVNELVKYL